MFRLNDLAHETYKILRHLSHIDRIYIKDNIIHIFFSFFIEMKINFIKEALFNDTEPKDSTRIIKIESSGTKENDVLILNLFRACNFVLLSSILLSSKSSNNDGFVNVS